MEEGATLGKTVKEGLFEICDILTESWIRSQSCKCLKEDVNN